MITRAAVGPIDDARELPIRTLDQLLKFFKPVELREAIQCPDYEDIMINPDGAVFVDADGEIKRLNITAGAVDVGLRNVARRLGKDFTRAEPILNTRLPDGSRVGAVMNQDGTVALTIRKFSRWYTTQELIAAGALPPVVSQTLIEGIRGVHGDAANILISGGTSSGKTTQAGALIGEIDPTKRLIVIEEPRELPVLLPNTLQWEAEVPTHGKPPTRTVSQLVAAALRHRPDHIIIGEVREPEVAYEVLQAMNTGHSGTLCTIHADGPEQALRRLVNLATSSRPNLNEEFVQRQAWDAINYVCHVSRRKDRKRGVRELVKVHRDGHMEYIYRA